MGRAVRREKNPAGTHLLAQFYKGPCMLRPRTEEPPLISNPGGGNYCTARRGERDGAARALRERGRRNGSQWLCFRLCPRSMRSLRPPVKKRDPRFHAIFVSTRWFFAMVHCAGQVHIGRYNHFLVLCLYFWYVKKGRACRI